MYGAKLFILATLASFGSASLLLTRQDTTNTCDANHACTAPGGCTGTCAPVSPEGGPPVCVNVCGDGESVFCPGCFAGNAEADGAPCQIDTTGSCTLISS
ncbi:hypothetical protein BDP27DRAFT_1315877 [Rhodocollybia butyracea]|uniref:Uncharacterized protein n=1 Tax=Rhodocollybia butyracea TaxID=206335 RepID=A0A9P5UEI6_9AGAR|nr:hypothetical protein BDP27DRAFT_1315877 [Rhodocollybia butyracea]